MKTLSRLKLNQLNAEELEQRQMNALRGGYNCACGCNSYDLIESSVSHSYQVNMSNAYSNPYDHWACGDGMPTTALTHS